MSPQSSRLSRRSFVENSALAFGLLGAAGLAPSNSYAADAAEASSLNVTKIRWPDHGRGLLLCFL